MNLQYVREIGWGNYVQRTLRYKFLTRVLRRDAVVKLPTGLRMSLPRASDHAAEIFGMGCEVDWGAEAILVDFLKETDGASRDFLDVGANIGFYSLLMAPLARSVHAFEPDPRNLPTLRSNIAQASNIHLLEKVVGAAAGAAHFDVSGPPTGSHLAEENADGSRILSVPMVSLDTYTAAQPGLKAAAVKIDVEGYDCLVLAGASELAQRDRPVFLIEFFIGPPFVNTLENLGRFLSENRYTIFAVVRDHDFARSRRAEFRGLTLDDLSGARTKMLFLAPTEDCYLPSRCGPMP